MASLRMLKKDIDYLVDAVLSDCFMMVYFRPDKKGAIVPIMEEAVSFRNGLIKRANHPEEKNNKSLVRKHYTQIRREVMAGTDSLFEKLGAAGK